MNLFERLGVSLKAWQMAWAGRGSTGWWWGGSASATLGPSTRIDYQREVGEAGARVNSAVVACLDALARMFVQAPVTLAQLAPEGEETEVRVHPFLALLRRPNPYYSGRLLLSATVKDRKASGNAYWLKVRAGAGRPVELWYVPSWQVEPVWPQNGTREFISGYEYKPGDGNTYALDPADVVHFRQGIDPTNVRKGLGALACLYQEIMTDQEGAAFTVTILRNAGVPSVVIMPETGKEIQPQDVGELKASFGAKFSGDRRGEPAVVSVPLHVQQMAFNPEQLNVRSLRRIPEERIAAVLGIPAIVAGLGAGLDRSTYSNAAEAQEMAYENTILPMQAEIADDLMLQLLPDFVPNPDAWIVRFDVSDVRVLQEDQMQLAERAATLVKGGLLTVDEGRQLAGWDELPRGAGAVLLLPATVVPTPIDALALPPPAARPAASAPPATPTLEERTADLFDAETRAWLSGAQTKAPADVGDAIVRVRVQLEPAAARDVHALLREQQQAVSKLVAELAAVASGVVVRGASDWKAGPDFPTALEGRLRAAFADDTRRTLVRIHTRALLGVTEVVADGFNVEIDPEPERSAYLRAAAQNADAIADTTLAAVRRTLGEGVAAGESEAQLIARLEELPAFDAQRAALVGRTELTIASNRAALLSYGQVPTVVGVQVRDGTDHDEPCASMNGRRFSLDEARGIPSIEHPRCVRAFYPLTR